MTITFSVNDANFTQVRNHISKQRTKALITFPCLIPPKNPIKKICLIRLRSQKKRIEPLGEIFLCILANQIRSCLTTSLTFQAFDT